MCEVQMVEFNGLKAYQFEGTQLYVIGLKIRYLPAPPEKENSALDVENDEAEVEAFLLQYYCSVEKFG